MIEQTEKTDAAPAKLIAVLETDLINLHKYLSAKPFAEVAPLMVLFTNAREIIQNEQPAVEAKPVVAEVVQDGAVS